MDVRTWTAREIQRLIEKEIVEYRLDCKNRGRTVLYDEMAEFVYIALNENGLIEHTP